MTEKNLKKGKKISVLIISFVIFFSATVVFAVKEYTFLAPGVFPNMGTTASQTSLVQFLGMVFDFGIAAAVVLALIMIIWGGIEYMTTDSWMGKDEGKTKITDALLGLGLALVSYLILYTINPALVTFTGNKFLGL